MFPELVVRLIAAALSQARGDVDPRSHHAIEFRERIIDAHLTQLPGCAKPSLNGATDRSAFQVKGPLMVDLVLMALRCGLTNVVTINVGDFYGTFLNPTFPSAYNIGHSIGHSQRTVGATGADAAQWQQWYDTMLANRRWRMGLLARLFDGLTQTRDRAGTMMDSTVTLVVHERS